MEVRPAGGRSYGNALRRARHLAMIGPAFAAAIAYVDPGNFATDFAAGADFGPRLLWVVVAANLLGMLVQALSAKLGLATGRNLAQLCAARFRRPVALGMWIQAECVAMATDLAEVIGGAIALSLLFGMPLLVGGVVTTALSFVVLAFDSRGKRAFEGVVAACLAAIIGGLAWDVARANVGLGPAGGGLLPTMPGTPGLLAACGIVGATVMPHAVFLHSDLTGRHVAETPPGHDRLPLLRQVHVDVFAALGIAGLANMAMLLVAAALRQAGLTGDATLQSIHAGIGTALGQGAALAFGVALLAAGLASTSVGTYAGQVVMAGFTNRSLPIALRRLITALPALAVLAAGVDPTTALIWSQVVLSFGIPFAVIPLVVFTRDRKLMGTLVNSGAVTNFATAVVGFVIVLNILLVITALR